MQEKRLAPQNLEDIMAVLLVGYDERLNSIDDKAKRANGGIAPRRSPRPAHRVS